MSFQTEIKARRILERWQGASEAHTRSVLQRGSNAAGVPKDQRIRFSLKAIWNRGNSAKTAAGSALDFEAQLWAAADKMRGQSIFRFLGA